ncbi:MAG: class II aldolase/adducin family protein [Arachnia sp.]
MPGMDFDTLSPADQIVEIGRNLWMKAMVAANDGNISVRLDDSTVLCTPTGVSKGYLSADRLSTVTLDGKLLSGPRPSSEVKMHLRVYEEDPDVRAVVHAHPLFSTALAVMGESLNTQMLPETIVAMPWVPLAPYAPPSTEAVPESIAGFVRSTNACLLEHHGALTWAGDLMTAYLGMERLEATAKLHYHLRLVQGERFLPESEVIRLQGIFGV